MTRRLVLAVPAIASLLAGCGSAGDALAGRSPDAVVHQAAQKVTAGPLRATLTGRLTVDISQVRNLSAADLRSFGLPVGETSVRATLEQESAKRQQVDVDLGGSGKLRAVIYDGQTFVSKDGGATYSSGALDALTGGLNISPTQLRDVIKNLSGVRDLGRRTVDGQDCEHLQAPITQAQLAGLLGGAGGGAGNGANAGGAGGGQGADLVKQLVQVRHGEIDLDVRHSDGALVRSASSVAIVLDLDRLAGLFGAAGAGTPAGIPGGSVSVDLSVDGHFSDYGASIHITRPRATADSSANSSSPGSSSGATPSDSAAPTGAPSASSTP
ncbi:MAG: hypothetical protein ABR541_02705 [Candidatus Dormibacteria bacterium]